ncbi:MULTISPECIES: polyphosphate polymerase domain-containing protein [unclassified Blastococcus]
MTGPAAPALPALGALPAIGLAEMVDRAALQTRVDRKYVLPLGAVDDVVAGLAETDGARVLEIDAVRSFGYASLYYDTPDLAGYHLAARRRRRRFKVRHRTYLDSGDHFLEVKTRGGRGTTVKNRIPLPGPARGLDGGAAFVDAVLCEAGLGWVRSEDLRPVLRTTYRRSTLHLPIGDSRLTIDTDLTWALPGGRALTLPGVAVVETKSSAAASAADRRLWRSGHRPSRISKYGTGLAALRGDLPDNTWCPVLRRHFHPLAAPATDDRTLP